MLFSSALSDASQRIVGIAEKAGKCYSTLRTCKGWRVPGSVANRGLLGRDSDSLVLIMIRPSFEIVLF
jgi:hypothetical protein